MRKLLLILCLPVLLVVASACNDNSSESKNNQAENAREQRSENQRSKEEWTVKNLIERTQRDLKEKLLLSDEVVEKIGKIYTEAYLEGGDSLDDPVTREKAKEIRITIMTESLDQVLPLLNEDQTQFYKRFLEK